MSRFPSRRSSSSNGSAVQRNYHHDVEERYMPSGDIVVDSAVDIADASPAATSHLHSASTEFLYLPSGEILAKPSSYHAGSSLETLLQNEKKRSLDKMRLLLDEQDKSHDLQTRFSSLQTKIKTLEATISRHDTHTRDLQASVAAANARQASLVHEISDKTKHVDKLTQDLATAQKTNALLLANTQPAASRPSPPLPTVATSYTQVQSRNPPVTSTSSSSLDALLGQFPALPRRIPSELGPSKDAAAVAMLQRRLALVDKEYRITHTKYIELKELCARQCVREADLQNFVVRFNEIHALVW
ncbi:hypothetical protein B5M09_009984 [Aphanomyces astaci]|uniref:Uncharacterized protein n=1 Tax=Aphanomyces astaci TaxID=112090 RepID=A0A425CW79_APHAT|nr:hypothetical protein B5M09_009984 [Aphanomyces astaci]